MTPKERANVVELLRELLAARLAIVWELPGPITEHGHDHAVEVVTAWRRLVDLSDAECVDLVRRHDFAESCPRCKRGAL